MIGKTIKFILKVIGAIILCGVLVWILAALNLGAVSNACKDIKNSILKYVDPVAVVKDAASDLLETGVEAVKGFASDDDDTVEAILQKVMGEDWEVMDLPDNAVEKKTIGSALPITLYRDPGYITITYKNTPVTFAVPAGTQKYISLLTM